MSKFIPGKEVLTLLDIRDFELFEYVKGDHLHPYEKNTGDPKPPPDIQLKLDSAHP